MDIARKRRTGILIGSLITILTAGVMLMKLSPFEMVEDKLRDYRFKIRGAVKPPDKIVIAAIDEKSIERLGRWPWDRDRIAQLLDKLTAAEAELVSFDIVYSEQEKNDPILGRAIRDAGNVLLPVVFQFEHESKSPASESLTESAFFSAKNHERFNEYNPIAAKGVLMPVPELIKEAMGLGFINMFPDADGTLRWEAMVIEYNGQLFPSITLKTAMTYLGIPPEKVVLDATKGIQAGKIYIPTDRWGRTFTNYYGPEQTFRHISISDILDDKIRPELLKGKIVLIGATAIGIYDLRVTPLSAAMPGVEKHASVIASILENRFLKTVSFSTDLIALLLSGALFSIIIVRFKAVGASWFTFLFFSVIFLSAYYLFAHKGLLVNITYPSINILLIFISNTAYNYMVEERYAKRIRAMFSSYSTERVVNELIKNPNMAKIGGERREVTVLFSDIRGFTTFSEKYSPEEVVAILNEYLGAMTEVIFKWEGTLDKFIGDAIVVFWGAPHRQENHAELAIRCAMNMINRLGELQEKWKAEGRETLDMGIGINTGEVIVGNIGAEGMKMDYTVIGDNVNLGARLEALTRRYDAYILISEFTMSKIKTVVETGKLGHVSARGLERVIVKGKKRPIGIYEVKSLSPESKSVITECEEGEVVVMKEK